MHQPGDANPGGSLKGAADPPGNTPGGVQTNRATSVFDFARALAEKVGLGPTQIRAAVRIWGLLTPESKRRLAGTDLARKHTELLALAEQSAPKQARILDLILGDDRPENVTQALEWIASGGSLPDMHERRFFAFSRSFGALAEAAFDSLLSAHEQRIIASLTRRGRI